MNRIRTSFVIVGLVLSGVLLAPLASAADAAAPVSTPTTSFPALVLPPAPEPSEDCYAEGEAPLTLAGPVTSSIDPDGAVRIVRPGYTILDCLDGLSFTTDALVDGAWQAIAGDGISGDDPETRELVTVVPSGSVELRLRARGYDLTTSGPVFGYWYTYATVDLVTPPDGPLTSSRPAIAGDRRLGGVVTAVPGVWGPAPVTLSYQWKADGVPIAGATSNSYRIGLRAFGRKLTVVVTGTKAGYSTVTATSPATGRITRLLP